MRATVLGAAGFIGRHLAAGLRVRGIECFAPGRNDAEVFRQPLGCVYYCIGLSADFRSRPHDTIEAHVCALKRLLEQADFERLIYLSSTRVYQGCARADEDQVLRVAPLSPDDLYNLSKLTGESLALASGRDCRIARLSNVIGPDMDPVNFLGSLLDEARQTGSARLQTSLESEKDYLWIDDAVSGLIAVAERGRWPIYNIAGGANVSHRTIAELLSGKGIRVCVDESAPEAMFPPISIERMVVDTGFRPAPVLPKLTAWMDAQLGPNTVTPPPGLSAETSRKMR